MFVFLLSLCHVANVFDDKQVYLSSLDHHTDLESVRLLDSFDTLV